MQILILLILVAFVLEAAFGTPVGPLTRRFDPNGYPPPYGRELAPDLSGHNPYPRRPVRRGLEDQYPDDIKRLTAPDLSGPKNPSPIRRGLEDPYPDEYENFGSPDPGHPHRLSRRAVPHGKERTRGPPDIHPLPRRANEDED
ncbi:hypothetical protein MJO28_002918 [Puccinia striiformis f. sp. tritici]|uniref:Uncharacterized protein n=2 Tax=Puccinia striiformis f. sp. tritici TaxID=168172 RepID=A0A0L0VJX7_9BASI|nr:hypothetical protein Pst134EA_005139 [Puccinia striiformis f. sp. tritici]KAI9619937.1 hypothetical protein H4Q26_013918 [Puccinia striiformis f. sp. tritici PST-130]KNE99309.1 hypothetical protein PSTG_07427 [Puccinia striiformis f. sp. tritici PST-78]KAH9462298.1 hypothetical protein Pst134EB_006202 [Puccinia striiformis f. sp. tritici]KAH9471233.1 hypothetical protein Pst134EA_005139 [Puccinia striiformis f. sp. tritici]KAI7959127.1 hypothetical protein MJO28_002918 [Puccinia striiformis